METDLLEIHLLRKTLICSISLFPAVKSRSAVYLILTGFLFYLDKNNCGVLKCEQIYWNTVNPAIFINVNFNFSRHFLYLHPILWKLQWLHFTAREWGQICSLLPPSHSHTHTQYLQPAPPHMQSSFLKLTKHRDIKSSHDCPPTAVTSATYHPLLFESGNIYYHVTHKLQQWVAQDAAPVWHVAWEEGAKSSVWWSAVCAESTNT